MSGKLGEENHNKNKLYEINQFATKDKNIVKLFKIYTR